MCVDYVRRLCASICVKSVSLPWWRPDALFQYWCSGTPAGCSGTPPAQQCRPPSFHQNGLGYIRRALAFRCIIANTIKQTCCDHLLLFPCVYGHRIQWGLNASKTGGDLIHYSNRDWNDALGRHRLSRVSPSSWPITLLLAQAVCVSCMDTIKLRSKRFNSSAPLCFIFILLQVTGAGIFFDIFVKNNQFV